MEKTRKRSVHKRRTALIKPKKAEYSPATMPFNFCDRHCERCDKFRNVCKVYQEESRFKLQCVMDGKDPADPKVVFEQIGRSMQQMMDMLKRKMEKEGIEITPEDMLMYEEEEDEKEQLLEKYPLHGKCQELADELHDFLSTFQISLPGISCIIASVEREVKELYFYSPLIMVKTERALFSKIEDDDEDDEFGYSDTMVSAALGYSSLLTTKKSLETIREFIKGEEVVWVMRINTILAEMAKVEKLFKKTFSGVEKYAEKVIFHGRHHQKA